MTAHKHWVLVAISLLLGITAGAQELPKAEVGFDSSYLGYAPNAVGTNGHSLNGGGRRLVFNINQYFGIKADLQGYLSTTSTLVLPPGPNFPTGASANVQGNLFTYPFGPQIKLHAPKIQPFVHALFGGAQRELSSISVTAANGLLHRELGGHSNLDTANKTFVRLFSNDN